MRIPTPLYRNLFKFNSSGHGLYGKFRIRRNASTTTRTNVRGDINAPYVGEVNPKNSRDNGFNRDRAAEKRHAAETAELWRKISLYVAAPALLLTSINAWNLWNKHWSHHPTTPPSEIKSEYPYQNIRTKKFPWGDGDKTLFWNTKVNYHKRDEIPE